MKIEDMLNIKLIWQMQHRKRPSMRRLKLKKREDMIRCLRNMLVQTINKLRLKWKWPKWELNLLSWIKKKLSNKCKMHKRKWNKLKPNHLKMLNQSSQLRNYKKKRNLSRLSKPKRWFYQIKLHKKQLVINKKLLKKERMLKKMRKMLGYKKQKLLLLGRRLRGMLMMLIIDEIELLF